MGNPPRTRKRVHGLPRAPDGSAFQTCGQCGGSVAIALADMHQCDKAAHASVKRFKGVTDKAAAFSLTFDVNHQPRSPFRFFMEEFVKSYGDVGLIDIDIDRKGVETWKAMSKEEREPYVKKAEMVNSAYTRSLLREVEDMSWVDDEADSVMVGKFDKTYEDYRYCNDYDSSDGSGLVEFESLNTWEWEMVKPWVVDGST